MHGYIPQTRYHPPVQPLSVRKLSEAVPRLVIAGSLELSVVPLARDQRPLRVRHAVPSHANDSSDIGRLTLSRNLSTLVDILTA